MGSGVSEPLSTLLQKAGQCHLGEIFFLVSEIRVGMVLKALRKVFIVKKVVVSQPVSCARNNCIFSQSQIKCDFFTSVPSRLSVS